MKITASSCCKKETFFIWTLRNEMYFHSINYYNENKDHHLKLEKINK